MNAPSEITSAAAPRQWFYGAAIILMLAGVAAAIVEKGREGAVAITVARRIASHAQETRNPETRYSRSSKMQIAGQAKPCGGYLGDAVVECCRATSQKVLWGERHYYLPSHVLCGVATDFGVTQNATAKCQSGTALLSPAEKRNACGCCDLH